MAGEKTVPISVRPDCWMMGRESSVAWDSSISGAEWAGSGSSAGMASARGDSISWGAG